MPPVRTATVRSEAIAHDRAYDDIITLPHHQSRKHPHMSRHQRAAQFMPFAALTGYNQVIEQTAKNAETAIAQAEAQGDTDFGA